MSKKNKSKIYIKRIISDIADLASDYDERIHIWYDETDITKVKALIIGAENTPYEDGFFYFSIDIPNTYPFNHPTVDFETINGDIRFNPNLYETGKVCLSIIGTWSGPKWSSVQTLKSLLLSIQSLMNENPINNEPGYDSIKINENKAIEYNEYVRFNKYEFAIYEMLTNKEKFPYFTEVIESYFVKNYNKIKKKLEKLTELDGKVMKTFIWNHSVNINYSNLINKFDELYEKLKTKNFSNTTSSVSQNTKKNFMISKDI